MPCAVVPVPGIPASRVGAVRVGWRGGWRHRPLAQARHETARRPPSPASLALRVGDLRGKPMLSDFGQNSVVSHGRVHHAGQGRWVVSNGFLVRYRPLLIGCPTKHAGAVNETRKGWMVASAIQP